MEQLAVYDSHCSGAGAHLPRNIGNHTPWYILPHVPNPEHWESYTAVYDSQGSGARASLPGTLGIMHHGIYFPVLPIRNIGNHIPRYILPSVPNPEHRESYTTVYDSPCSGAEGFPPGTLGIIHHGIYFLGIIHHGIYFPIVPIRNIGNHIPRYILPNVPGQGRISPEHWESYTMIYPSPCSQSGTLGIIYHGTGKPPHGCRNRIFNVSG